MKSVIIGTAGHIDHGKTALVKALTGIDADRLEEEKRRGITIDIGFAHRELTAANGEKLRLGFVDVPGHERFVRNMLSGIGGIDIVLLVIAADESIKPQTREHFDICRLLSVRRGITVLTKSDAVDAETLDVVKLEVEEFLRGSFLDPNPASPSPNRSKSHDVETCERPDHSAGAKVFADDRRPTTDDPAAPIIAVSSLTGAGLTELTRALAQIAAEVPSKDPTALARLPIDRVFTMKGFGTVITGTLVSGTIRKEDELEVFPIGKRVRVRGMQVHGESADKAIAGQRTALNLAGVTVGELSRGMMLAPPDTFRATKKIDVSLSLLSSAKPLKDRARVHLHAYTSETIAEVGLYDRKVIKPGETAFAQLRMADPALLLPGDRFIVRQFSPVVTIGGGAMLDPLARRPMLRDTGRTAYLETLERGNREEILAAMTERAILGLGYEEIVARTAWVDSEIRDAAKKLSGAGRVKTVCAEPLVLVSEKVFVEVRKKMLEKVEKFQKDNPLLLGIQREDLRASLGKRVRAETFRAALEELESQKKLDAAGELVKKAGSVITLQPEEAKAKDQIEAAFASASLQAPSVKEVLANLAIEAKRAEHEKQLSSLSAEWDEALDRDASPSERRTVLEALRDRMLERNYINNLLTGIERELNS